MTTRPLAIVTGASSGIGRELARLAARDGYDLVLAADRPLAEIAGELRGHGGAVDCVETDLAKMSGVDEVLAATDGRPVARLFANAGQAMGGAFLDQAPDVWRHTIDTNITGTLYLVQQVASRMVAAGRGQVLITGSIAGHTPGPFIAVYNATKAFIDNFSDALNNELGDSGVTITCLKPGATDTEFFARAGMEDNTMVGRSMPKDDPAAVALSGYAAMAKGERVVIHGPHNKAQVAFGNVVGGGVAASVTRPLFEPDEEKAKH